MASDFSIAGRVRGDASGAGRLLSFDDVQDRLVEAIDVRLRSQGSGYWPFASDGPWHLIQRDWEQLVNDALQGRDAPLRRRAPSRAELAAMRVRLEWLMLVAKDDDRRLLVVALTKLARGHAQVPWRALVEDRPRWRAPDALRMRYGRALSALTMRVNRLPLAERMA